jgi:Predicted nucleotidyltransferases
MTKHGIDLASEAIQAFCRKWKITELSVFGSIVRDDFRPDSDVDFLVSWDESAEWDICDHLDMEEELGGILGRKVDLVSRSTIETSKNRFRKKEILSTAEPVIC